MSAALPSAGAAAARDAATSHRPAPLAVLVKTWPKLSETFILEEVLGLERAGVSLRLYALQPPTDEMQHPVVAQVRAPLCCVPPLRAGHAPGYFWRHLRLALAAPLQYVQALRGARRQGTLREFLLGGWLAAQLRNDGVAHLHAHFIHTPAEVAAAASTLAGLPFSISAHAKDIYTSRPADLQRRLRAARFTVTCTEFNRQTLAALAPGATVRRMYHGIDQRSFNPGRRVVPAGVPLLLAVGRLRAKKGLDTLVQACRLLQARGVAFRCQIVGYGEEHDRLQAQIDHHGLQDQVKLVGKLAREQVIACYAQASVFVQPSRVMADGDRDGIPNVLLEAMAMGLPVVASRVSGIPELVRHRHNGLLVEPDDEAALADAMAYLLYHPALAASLGRSARTAVSENFDNDTNLQLLTRLLETPHACSTACAHA
ncbi:MAG: glycosyltransferase [Rubrivivax sp.]|nr:glycosyltransferase [Rubrivivax sp.]